MHAAENRRSPLTLSNLRVCTDLCVMFHVCTVVAKRRVSLLTRAGDVSGSRGRRCGRGGVPAVGGSQVRRAPVPLLPTYLSSSRILRTLLAGFLFL